jgi:hypothetical protein
MGTQCADIALGQEGDIPRVARLVIEPFQGQGGNARNMLNRLRDDRWDPDRARLHILWNKRIGQKVKRR